MARENNFLLGNGERLTRPEDKLPGGRPKNPPYTFGEAKERLSRKLQETVAENAKLKPEVCPNGEAVAVITMHPRYISKSDFPGALLNEVGLRPVGNRIREIAPEKWGTKKPPSTPMPGEDIFVAGQRDAFAHWSRDLEHWRPIGVHNSIVSIEEIGVFPADAKIRALPETPGKEVLLEVVLHNADSREIPEAFYAYADRIGARPLPELSRKVKGLTFVPVRCAFETVIELAAFSFLRVARGMPSLRPVAPHFLRSTPVPVVLPKSLPPPGAPNVVVFDGGLPGPVQEALSPWVTCVEGHGIGARHSALEAHGLGVTSALLFGPLTPGKTPDTPPCRVTHVRVVDGDDDGSDLMYVKVQRRIVRFMEDHRDEHQLYNCSMGPQMALDDDEVTEWTASFDELCSSGSRLITVAAGNDGHLSPMYNRVQPPADGVNVLSVGAIAAHDGIPVRAPYSCRGPGRCPGMIKPDGVAFGGSDHMGFGVLDAKLTIRETSGTSFASPFALRSAAAIHTQLGSGLHFAHDTDNLTPLVIRALLIHRAKPPLIGKRARKEKWDGDIDVGWGLFEHDPRKLITCDDDEALIIYRGELPVTQYLRADVPMPDGEISADITVVATLLIATDIDPENAGNYTRSGLKITFRPDATVFEKEDSHYPKADGFFPEKPVVPEYQLRVDGKWEPCRRQGKKYGPGKLNNPFFHIDYQHRRGLGRDSNPKPIPYVLVVSVKAEGVNTFYNTIAAKYSHILVPMKPVLDVKVPLSRG